MSQSLNDLLDQSAFQRRHIGPDEAEIGEMLSALGLDSLTALADAAVPEDIRLGSDLELPESASEPEVVRRLRELAAQNTPTKSLIGQGYYGTHVPALIQRNVLENPGWYTAYTPYQAEISQGRLEALLSFQQLVMDLTGMDLANASLLDEATAAAEAMALCKRAGSSKSDRFFVADDVHPQTLQVLKTRSRYFGFELVVGDPATELDAHEVFGVQLQYPGATGRVRDLSPIIEAAHAQGALVSVASDLLALALLKPPGEMGADVVLGSAQRFGVPLGFGGPHAAFFAAKSAYKRLVPGRIIGVSQDKRGKTALRMAMQTREQHIRRERATSNICTAQALLAVMSAFYAVYHGPEGIKRIAQRVQRLTDLLAWGLLARGARLRHDSWFDTLTLELGETQEALYQRARSAGFTLRKVGQDALGLSLDETTTLEDVEVLWRVFGGQGPNLETWEREAELLTGRPRGLERTSSYLSHPVFNRYHSETEMLRYLKRLENKDFSLVHGMIPLGSCTMKLNATTEMLPVSWREFADLHPFAPAEDTGGYQELIGELSEWLKAITGYDAISMQPNSGAQGEYAGLLAIRRYQASRDEGERDICLIPSSAHGTNPASASMMGLTVVVVKTDPDGNIALDDLREKAEKHAARLSCLMITYPSTHGVFEPGVREVCDIVHRHGGQVYLDGANLNAQVGLTQPALIGSDVSHLNLHKTFCIPHGGGGPGMGPIGVKKHLEPFLPGHDQTDGGEGAVSAAPFGSALILPVSWAYIRLMGREGLRRATEVAILSANYLAKRLEPHYPVLYRGQNGLVAHECIIDIRPLREKCGVTEEDIAKRLMDYGFHAPTMSFPVPGTLMIEPTESEGKGELDRFCEALIHIREEIAALEQGEMSLEASPLRNAPHTLQDLVNPFWDRPYSREEAVFPTPAAREHKFWPSVNRIDNAYGDRHFVCSCPPIERYLEEEAQFAAASG